MNPVAEYDVEKLKPSYCKLKYAIHPHHRNGNPKKSQWIISEEAEVSCFKRSFLSEWLNNSVGWGLHIVNGNASALGLAVDRTTYLVFSKFVTDNQVNWHGYPANHVSNQHDIPDEHVAMKWISDKLLPSPKVSKIMRGKPCAL